MSGELVAVFGAAERRWFFGWSVTLYGLSPHLEIEF